MGKRKVAIVGSGILGVTLARELLATGKNLDISVYEKEAAPALHQTGHNSGVVHAGIYYTPGSLKAQLARKGAQLTIDYCREHGLRYDVCGKLIAAKNPTEHARLENILAHGLANGVPGLELIGQSQIAELEPNIRAHSAIYSPSTAIVDFAEITRHMAEQSAEAGVEYHYNTTVRRVLEVCGGVVVETDQGDFLHDVVVTCAGLQSDRLATRSLGKTDLRIIPFYGEYYQLTPDKAALINGLVYPVPDPDYPFLGVHITSTIDGRVTIGPNAFLSLAREKYGKHAISIPDVLTTLTTEGFWKFAWNNRSNAVREFISAMSKSTFVRGTQEFLPTVTASDVLPYRRGIRAQVVHTDGTLEDDFVIHRQGNIVHVRNAPSPAATSSIAIAQYILHGMRSSL